MRALEVMFIGAFALSVGACAGPGAYVWAKDLPQTPGASNDYLIASGDVLGVRVVNQDGMSTKARVRSDGRIALPLLGDIDVRGKTPNEIRKELEARFKEFIVAPSVTVTVEESAPLAVSVLGEVSHPGIVQMDATAGLAQALAGAGGLTDYASRDRIFVIRHDTKPTRVRFTFDEIANAEPAVMAFTLRRGDVVVVE
jgi:polysaccharide export outer membrane protein